MVLETFNNNARSAPSIEFVTDKETTTSVTQRYRVKRFLDDKIWLTFNRNPNHNTRNRGGSSAGSRESDGRKVARPTVWVEADTRTANHLLVDPVMCRVHFTES